MKQELITYLAPFRKVADETQDVDSVLKGLPLLYYVLQIFVLAENALVESSQQPWMRNENLNKRRKTGEFDNQLQQMLLYVGKITEYDLEVISCGGRGYYKTELKSSNGDYIHINHSTNLNSKYYEEYLNKNVDEVKFAYFDYELSKDRNKVESLKYVVPAVDKDRKSVV